MHYHNAAWTGDFNLSTPLTHYEKKKSPRWGIDPGSSGRKARLMTIRPRWRNEIFDKKKKVS